MRNRLSERLRDEIIKQSEKDVTWSPYYSFTLCSDKKDINIMVIVKMPESYYSWDKVIVTALRKVTSHYGASISDVSGEDGIDVKEDDPNFKSAIMNAFNGSYDNLSAFELWKWNDSSKEFDFVRSAKKE